MTRDSRDTLVSLRNVETYYGARGGLRKLIGYQPEPVKAVDGIDLDIARGEVIGLVGESGAGKTTLAKTIMQLTALTAGRIVFDGRDISGVRQREIRQLRRRMQMIFQDPHSSLSPRLSIGYQLTEPYKINNVPTAERYGVTELLEMVELPPDLARKYPHEISGGQARRVGIARALTLGPEFLVADEPTSGLDVSAAASVLNLMQELQRRLGLTYLIITHNLNTVAYMADRIGVMYLGQLVEIGLTDQIFETPAHPYTASLIAAISEPDPRHRRTEASIVRGEIPSPKNPPPGCRFHTRCPFAVELCRVETPELEIASEEHQVACHLWREIRRKDRAAT